MKLNENERIDDLEYKGLKIIQDIVEFLNNDTSRGFCTAKIKN